MDDWDPFADPGDDATLQEEKKSPKTSEKAEPAAPGRRKPVDDIFAALRSEEERALGDPSPVASAPDLSLIGEHLDKLFSIEDDDVEALRKEFASLTTLSKGGHFLPMWSRSLPLLELSAPTNLLGLMIDDCLGFLADPSSNSKQATLVDAPAGARSNEVVFLLSWGGGTLLDMQDLRDWYREIFPGCTIFISTSNQKQSFGLRCQCAEGIRAAADAWSLSSGKPKLLVHLFSNSGMHAWTELLQTWNTLQACHNLEEQGVSLPMPLPPMSDVLCGVILDSAPDGQVTAEACIQSLVQSVAAVVSLAVSVDHDGSAEKKKETEVASKRAVSAIIGTNSIVKAYLQNKPEKMMTKLSSADTVVVHALEPPVPLQFIYSKDDNIIVAQGVERYLQEVNERPSRKGLALPRVWCIEKSRHCFHKITHRDEYRKRVKLFASSTMT